MSPIRNGTFLSLSLCTNSIEKNQKNSQTLFLYTKYKSFIIRIKNSKNGGGQAFEAEGSSFQICHIQSSIVWQNN
jgi:hypothetical protein